MRNNRDIPEKAVLRITETANVLRCSVRTIYRMIGAGELDRVRPGMISRNSLLRRLDEEH